MSAKPIVRVPSGTKGHGHMGHSAVVSAVRLLGGNTQSPGISSVFLSKPDLSHHSAELECSRFVVGLTAMQGWRSTMEDAHTVQLRLDEDASLFAVFDGHGGHDTALYAASNIVAHIKKSPYFEKRDYGNALRDAYISIDKDVVTKQKSGGGQLSGSTANCIIITKTEIICANVGDSRAVLCRDLSAIDLSEDHKPAVKTEQERIAAAGGTITGGRVNGLLAMTRALGDHVFKSADKPPEKHIVTCIPEVKTIDVDPANDRFIVMACDGIWDCLRSQEVVDFFLEEVREHNDVALMCENLCELLVAPTLHHFGTDNMTVMCIWFREAMSRPIQAPASATISGGSFGSFRVSRLRRTSSFHSDDAGGHRSTSPGGRTPPSEGSFPPSSGASVADGDRHADPEVPTPLIGPPVGGGSPLSPMSVRLSRPGTPDAAGGAKS